MTIGADAKLTNTQGLIGLIALVSIMLGAGVIVAVARAKLTSKNDSGSLIRSWIAITLVGGLLLATALSFELKDDALRNTLVGGVVANVGAAVAFYFASKAADQAREDILGASFGSEKTPNLVGKTVAEATADVARSALMLVVTPENATGVVTKQVPDAGVPAAKGSHITVTANPT